MVVGVEATSQSGALVSRPNKRLFPPHLSSTLIDGDGGTRVTDFTAIDAVVCMVVAVVARRRGQAIRAAERGRGRKDGDFRERDAMGVGAELQRCVRVI